jgi:RHS repeat-associated protein
VVGPNNQILSDGTFTYDHDNEGNVIRKTEIATGEYTEFEYDHRNRLVRGTVKSAGGIILREVVNRFDVFDRRIARTADLDGAGAQPATTVFTVFDGVHAWADYDVSGNVLARYLYGALVDEIVARFRPGEGTAWYLTDHLGTVRDLVNAAGVLINHIDYDSFGNILAQTNPAAGDRFTFTGREWDAELQLYYYRARFYDPRLGRFTSQDPLGFAAGDVNLYRYVGNNPLGATDPSGSLALLECAVVRAVQPVVSLACAVAELWASGNLESKELDIQVENALTLLQAAADILPTSGAGLAFQFTLRALTAKTAMEVVAPFMGRYAGIGFAIHGVYNAWIEAQRTNNYKQFWVTFVCTVIDLGMMVWAAKARCFVAGTPVVIGLLPPVAPVADEGNGDQAWLWDGLGGVALLVGAAAVLADRERQRQSQKRRPPAQPREDDLPPADGLPHDPLPPEELGEQAGERETAPRLVRRPEASGHAPPPTVEPAEDQGDAPVPARDSARSEEVKPVKDRKKGSWFLPLLALASFLFAGFSLAPRIGQLWQKTESTAVAASEQPRFLTKPIEQVRPGDRVLADNPEGAETEPWVVDPDPHAWRRLRLELIGWDGHRVDVELLRPRQWVEENGAAVGGKVWLDLEELGAEGEAAVLEVSEGPSIQAGSGRVVTGTFRHESNDLVDVHIDGHPSVGCTASHPFWSQDRRAFVRADQLRRGERLLAADGRIALVTSVSRRAGSETVYNLEVESEHVYHVGRGGVLVHNACTKGTPVKPSVTKDASGRITHSSATITQGNLRGGTGTTEASRRGLGAGDDAGHIIGRLLGGQGGATADNIFPQLSSVNRGQYRVHEAWVADQVRHGHNVQVDVQLVYPNATSTRPSQIIYTTTVNGTPTTVTFNN